MKKLFIGALALTMFTACSQDEIVEQQQLSSAITFEGAFVNNATRAAVDPSTTTDGPKGIKEISVWGFMDEADGYVFTEELVSKDINTNVSNSWGYKNTQYWTPKHNYYFSAISPVKDDNVKVAVTADDAKIKNGLGTVTFTNQDGTTDLLYDATTVNTDKMKAGDVMDPVRFTMNHLLSKVKFTFTNGFKNANNTLVVTNIKMVAPKTASIDLTTETWANDDAASKWKGHAGETTLSFGHLQAGSNFAINEAVECDYERLTIPAGTDQEYIVTFDVQLWSGNVIALKRSLSTTISKTALQIGKAYNFKATLDHTNIAEIELKPILFEVETVDTWETGTGDDLNTMETTIVNVGSVEELEAAVADGATNFKITNDLNLTYPLNFGQTVSSSRSAAATFTKEYVLDLNGKTIKNENGDAIVAVGEGVKLTINGDGNVKAATAENGASGNAVWAHHGATVIINGGNYYVGSDPTSTTGSKRNDCIYAGSATGSTNGYIYIYGGNFSVKEDNYNKEYGQYWVLNLRGGTASNIVVYGGTFKNYDPSNNVSESPAKNFVAPGYGVEVEGEYYTVKELPTVSINVAANTTQVLNSNVIVELPSVVAGILDGNGYTLFANHEVTSNNGFIRPTGTATIKNLTIDGENKKAEDGKSLRAFYINADGTYTIENVITKGTGYALNCGGEKAPNATLNVSNSTFEGWTSYSATVTATFNTVKFTRGNYFANADQNGYFRPYGTTTLEGCDFALGFIVDFGFLAEGKTITFKNCKYNGAALTAENIPAIWENYAEKAASITIE